MAATLLLILALALPRLIALDRYTTIDEPLWLMRLANFYNALWTRDWKNTYQGEHPGVTILWAGLAGFLVRFPGYVKLADEQFKKANKFREFLISKNRAALDLLVAGRAFTTLAVILVLLLAFPLMVRLAGWGLSSAEAVFSQATARQAWLEQVKNWLWQGQVQKVIAACQRYG